jgi:hypothetical protein
LDRIKFRGTLIAMTARRYLVSLALIILVHSACISALLLMLYFMLNILDLPNSERLLIFQGHNKEM